MGDIPTAFIQLAGAGSTIFIQKINKESSPPAATLHFRLIVYVVFKLNSMFAHFLMIKIVYFDTLNSIILSLFNKQ